MLAATLRRTEAQRAPPKPSSLRARCVPRRASAHCADNLLRFGIDLVSRISDRSAQQMLAGSLCASKANCSKQGLTCPAKTCAPATYTGCQTTALRQQCREGPVHQERAPKQAASAACHFPQRWLPAAKARAHVGTPVARVIWPGRCAGTATACTVHIGTLQAPLPNQAPLNQCPLTQSFRIPWQHHL